jgi:hypothetical protein
MQTNKDNESKHQGLVNCVQTPVFQIRQVSLGFFSFFFMLISDFFFLCDNTRIDFYYLFEIHLRNYNCILEVIHHQFV